MDDRTTTANTTATTENIPASIYDDLVSQCDHMMQEYWHENPDLHRIVQQKNQEAAMAKIGFRRKYPLNKKHVSPGRNYAASA